MGFRDGHFWGNVSACFRSNIFESSNNISLTTLSFVIPSVNTISRTDCIIFISRHTSLSDFTPSTVNISGTEITIRNSQTHFIIRKILNITTTLVSNWDMDNFSSNFVLNMSGMFNSDVFQDKGGLRPIRRSFGMSSKMLIKVLGFRGDR